ncbi:MAG: asparagine synthase (glutamine-hydrolyzing) [Caldilineaceae bacterium]
MCGIAGKVTFTGAPVAGELIHAMCDGIAHRGPDESGVYVKGVVGIGNRRLSIIDLAGGHQPICNEDETIWIVFNGEIYNFLELRELLVKKGHRFKTNSDTEAIVHLYEEYGVDCLQHLNGMFAFAIWDEAHQRLLLARDRLGKKPVVYALTKQALTFASEIHALLQDGTVPRRLDLEALNLYLTLLYVPSPWTMLKDVRKLPPGHYLLWEQGEITIKRYWDVKFNPHPNYSEAEAIAEIRALLEDSVRRRLISDVPLGAFLSGGLDSSTIVALMTKITGQPVRTFSIGFDDDVYGELPYAREVAQRFGTEHHEMLVQPKMVEILPRLVRHYGEPFGDGSAVPTYYVSQLASQSVKVVLSGDGGDEVFGGYPWYVNASRHGDLARSYLLDGFRAVGTAWQQRQLRPMLGAVKGTAIGLGVALRGWQDEAQSFERLITFFGTAQRERLYTEETKSALLAGQSPSALIRTVFTRQNGGHFLNRMFYTDHHMYLPDDILVKVDIASMANSLEVRSPFLDYRLIELSASLPPAMKVQGSSTKRILRKVVADLVPESILTRPKVGFGIPVDRWMRDELYPMAYDLLQDQTARGRGLFEPYVIEKMLTQHKAGYANYGYQLWLLLFFEVWHRECLDAVAVVPV